MKCEWRGGEHSAFQQCCFVCFFDHVQRCSAFQTDGPTKLCRICVERAVGQPPSRRRHQQRLGLPLQRDSASAVGVVLGWGCHAFRCDDPVVQVQVPVARFGKARGDLTSTTAAWVLGCTFSKSTAVYGGSSTHARRTVVHFVIIRPFPHHCICDSHQVGFV